MRFDYNTDYRQSFALLRHAQSKIVYALLALALTAAPWVVSDFALGEMTYVLILCIASMGLMVLTGYTGQVSLGHAAFLAIGAYAHAWLLTQGTPLLLSLVLAALLCAVVGLALGFPAIRVSGLYLAMVTLAFSVIVTHVIGNWNSVTGGFTGLAVPPPELMGLSLGSAKGFYGLCLVIAALVLMGLANVLRSGIGRTFLGVRDSEAAAYSLGIPVAAVKVGAFALSAGLTGLAGGLLAHHTQYLTPDGFSLILSMELMLMVVIGGLGSLRGAIFGAVLISLLPTFISQVKPLLPQQVSGQFGLESFVFGAVLAVFVLFEPTGLNGRWLKLKALFENFPLYRRDTFRRNKRYMKSERYR
jgi:branched-chain amino acid transport system permease protein